MDVPRVAPILVRATPVETTIATGRPIQFVVGQRIAAVVAEVLGSGEALIDTAGLRMVARTSVSLTPGEQLELEVVRSGPEIQLRVVGSRADAPEALRAAAALYQARLQAPAGVQPPNAAPEAALREDVAAWLRAATPVLPAGEVAKLTELLSSVRADLPVARLAQAIRGLVEDGGVFVESRLKAILVGLPADATLSSLPPTVAADLRVLLGALARSLTSEAPGRAGGAATAEIAAENAAARPATDVRATDVIARLAQQVLAQQLDLALQWVRHGEMHAHVPVQFGPQESSVRLRVLRDAPRDPELAEGPAALHTFEVSLDLEAIGRLDARVQWAGSSLSARIVVEQDAVVPLVEAELAPLVRGLNEAGFTSVATAVRVDPARLAESDRVAIDPPPGGSLLRVRG
jgi:hypothetical protein